jgi:hypothetical protein
MNITNLKKCKNLRILGNLVVFGLAIFYVLQSVSNWHECELSFYVQILMDPHSAQPGWKMSFHFACQFGPFRSGMSQIRIKARFLMTSVGVCSILLRSKYLQRYTSTKKGVIMS